MFNLAVTFIAAALLAPSAVVGQDPTLSACVTNCSTLALPSGPCTALTDLACVCTSQDFLTAASACITQDCPADLAGAIAAQTAECSAYGNGTTTNSTSDAGTGSSSTSAGVVPPVGTGTGTTTRAAVTGATTRPPSGSSTSRSTTSTSTTSTGAGFHTASIASGVTLALFGAAFSLF